MTAKTKLLEIIAHGEDSRVEFKRDDLPGQHLASELVAFSNLEGGMVLLGVEDDGSFSGLARTDIEQWVMNVCRNKIRPPIIPFFEIVRDVEEDKGVAVVRVPRAHDVHALWHNGTNRYLLRVGTRSREASPEELARLFRQRGSLRADMLPVSGTALAHLDLRRLHNYFSDIRQQDTPCDNDRDGWRSLLVNTEIMTEEGVTVGGMLLFGKTPNRFLPQAGIDAVSYPGAEKDYEARERRILRGPMTPLRTDEREIVENGLVEQALEFVRRNTRTTAELAGGQRVERPAYPPDVLRESVVNALIHRDCLLANADIELATYGDRLEIVSPGRLPNGVTPERMRAGVRSTRNQLLKDVMRDYGYLEHMGMGVPRKIVKGMKEHNGTDVGLVEEGERFTVRLSAGGGNDG